MKDKVIAFIGCGNMGRCLVGGLIADGYPSENLRVSDPDHGQLEVLARQFPVRVETDNIRVVSDASVVVLAVKPQVMKAVVTELAETIRGRCPLIVSIAAGIGTSALSRWLGGEVPIVRAMPNTPALVGSGATALYAFDTVSRAQREIAESILRAVGLTVWLDDEALMDAITAISGSGPAYFFLFMELIQNVAVRMGLPVETARLLTLQTAFGAAKMALESSSDAASLRAQVTSPGGTTEQALRVFQQCGLERLVEQALQAAQTRSNELARVFGES